MNLHYDFVCLIFRQHVKIWYQLLIHFEPIFKLELVTNQKSWSEILSIFFVYLGEVDCGFRPKTDLYATKSEVEKFLDNKVSLSSEFVNRLLNPLISGIYFQRWLRNSLEHNNSIHFSSSRY